MIQVIGESLIELKINGEKRKITARPADTLLYVLREKLGLTGAKNGCENGDCDTCTVLLDGWPVKACLTLAAETIGHEITTVEFLHNAPIQKAFVEKFAIQCGYCTPGLIMNCQALLNIHPHASEDLIKEWLESNLCRCTGYETIKEAIKAAQSQQS